MYDMHLFSVSHYSIRPLRLWKIIQITWENQLIFIFVMTISVSSQTMKLTKQPTHTAEKVITTLISNKTPQVKSTVPKMDRNGYFFYVASTAKKKKINLMQPKPPRVAFVEEKRRPGVAERVYTGSNSVAPTATENGRGDPMSQRGPSPAPRARLYTQLESYQPRYHTIRDNSDKRVESECRRRKEKRIVGYPQPQPVIR